MNVGLGSTLPSRLVKQRVVEYPRTFFNYLNLTTQSGAQRYKTPVLKQKPVPGSLSDFTWPTPRSFIYNLLRADFL